MRVENKKISKLRKEISMLIKKRILQEKNLFRKDAMVAGAFIRRDSGANYLSASIKGESRHRYIRKSEILYWEKLAREWKKFSRSISRWVIISNQIEEKFRELGRIRCESLPRGKSQKKGSGNGSS